VTAFTAFDPCKSVIQKTAIKITINDLFHIRTEKTILPCKAVIIDLFESLKMILHTLVIK